LREGITAGIGTVWTDGFILLLQSMVGSVAAATTILYYTSPLHVSASLILLDVTLSLAILLGVLWRHGLPGPPLWPSLPAALPAAAICWLHHAEGGVCAILLALSAASRAYFAVSALSLITSQSSGLILGADTTLVQLAIVAALVVASGAVMVYAVESRVPGSPIRSFGDALWWALTTVTTVGYGDIVPVTVEGRIIASLLMLFGIGSFGVFISDMAARIARITILGIDSGSVIDKTKLTILRRLARLEELDDSELEMLLSQLRAIHAIERSSTQIDPQVLEVFAQN